ncbi:SGNH/GDSL hydrolase family protein [Mesonia aquimarina]|uniref:SGNH/GDSL hydrolase family protein n=1 Tax=Mesonia aquimarina TaxID=1504967 RepID=UPI000EF5A45D|nr:SGNH/GDSL hydrolase family protein [Mesonia aquimarina]
MKKKLFLLVLILTQFFISCEDDYMEKELPEVKVLNSLGVFSIAIEDNQLILAPKHTKITAPLLYQDDINNFNFNALYRIKNEEGEMGYFRFGWIEYKDSENILSNINWFYTNPPTTWGFEDFTIETVEVASTQKGNLKVCTIGDSQTWWSKSSLLRKKMNDIYPDLYFTGSNTDIYGFPHEGEGGNDTKKVLERMGKIPEADFYTLLIGTNDWKNDIYKSTENIKEIINYLLKKYPSSKIIYLSPLPTINGERDRFNQALKLNVMKFAERNPKILSFSLGEKMRENKNWATDYFKEDGLHPNEEGVKFMAENITSFIKQETD